MDRRACNEYLVSILDVVTMMSMLMSLLVVLLVLMIVHWKLIHY